MKCKGLILSLLIPFSFILSDDASARVVIISKISYLSDNTIPVISRENIKNMPLVSAEIHYVRKKIVDLTLSDLGALSASSGGSDVGVGDEVLVPSSTISSHISDIRNVPSSIVYSDDVIGTGANSDSVNIMPANIINIGGILHNKTNTITKGLVKGGSGGKLGGK